MVKKKRKTFVNFYLELKLVPLHDVKVLFEAL